MSDMSAIAKTGLLLAAFGVVALCTYLFSSPTSPSFAQTELEHVPLSGSENPQEASASRANRAAKTIDLVEQVELVEYWTLPPSAHLPGVESSHLSNTLADWILSLPIDKQDAARQFAARYAPAYEIDHKAIQAWMLDMGFPSLEEVAVFDINLHARDCSRIDCKNPKIAALAADHFVQQMERLVPASATESTERVAIQELMSSAQNEAFTAALGEAQMYVNRVKESGNVVVAAYLQARVEQLMGMPESAGWARSFAAACGDRRARTGSSTDMALGRALLTMAHGSPCNLGPGRPLFPHVVGVNDYVVSSGH
jgi:hypothetical protein